MAAIERLDHARVAVDADPQVGLPTHAFFVGELVGQLAGGGIAVALHHFQMQRQVALAAGHRAVERHLQLGHETLQQLEVAVIQIKQMRQPTGLAAAGAEVVVQRGLHG